VKEPVWLTRGVVEAVQDELLARFGGLAGIRDEGLLESALQRPKHLLTYGCPSVFELAAAYAHGIVKNHAFMDGNKRAGFMAAYIFLGANGQDLDAPEAEAVIQTVALASGDIDEVAFAAWLERSCIAASC
jgi:death-on-curing protein